MIIDLKVDLKELLSPTNLSGAQSHFLEKKYGGARLDTSVGALAEFSIITINSARWNLHNEDLTVTTVLTATTATMATIATLRQLRRLLQLTHDEVCSMESRRLRWPWHYDGPDGHDSYDGYDSSNGYDSYDSYDSYNGYRLMRSVWWNLLDGICSMESA